MWDCLVCIVHKSFGMVVSVNDYFKHVDFSFLSPYIPPFPSPPIFFFFFLIHLSLGFIVDR
jgi:hypothetical protein